MMYDIKTFHIYFRLLVLHTPSLSKIIADELANLVIIHECVGLAIKGDTSTFLEKFITILHMRIGGNVQVTRYLIADLCLMAASPGKNANVTKP